jgi:chaperonin cofactor prefoldin
MNTVNPELRDLEQQVIQIRDRVAKAEGEIQQLNRTAGDTTKQTIWQFVIFTVTMAAVLLGGMYFQTEALRRESNVRFEALQSRIEQSEKALTQRIEQSERSLNARFEDLKQEVRASRGR